MNWKAGIIVMALGFFAAGCFSPDPKSLKSNGAPSLVPAIKDAAAKDDRTAIPRLIDCLDNDDPAIRFAAITALEQMTGQSFDYEYYQDEPHRRPAVARWRQWLKDQPAP